MPNCAITNINSKEKNDQNTKDKAMLNEMRQMQLLEDLKETMNKLNKRIDEVESPSLVPTNNLKRKMNSITVLIINV